MPPCSLSVALGCASPTAGQAPLQAVARPSSVLMTSQVEHGRFLWQRRENTITLLIVEYLGNIFHLRLWGVNMSRRMASLLRPESITQNSNVDLKQFSASQHHEVDGFFSDSPKLPFQSFSKTSIVSSTIHGDKHTRTKAHQSHLFVRQSKPQSANIAENARIAMIDPQNSIIAIIDFQSQLLQSERFRQYLQYFSIFSVFGFSVLGLFWLFWSSVGNPDGYNCNN